MRVLFITGEFPPMQGGVGDCTNEIARALAKRGVEVAVLTSDRGSLDSARTRASLGTGSTNDYRPPNTAYHPPPTGRDEIQVYRTIKQWDWSALSKIRATIPAAHADIFHIQYQTGAFGMHPMINFAPRLLSTLPPLSPPSPKGRGGGAPRRGCCSAVRRLGASNGVRAIVTFHDLRPMYLFPKAGRARDWVTFELARKSDAVVATNDEDYSRLATLNLKLLTLIPIGSNIDPTPPPDFDRASLRAQLGVGPDEILLCYFGFLNESKGGETLIRALAELPDAKLLMLGGQVGASDATNTAYLAQVKATVDALRLTSRVIWTDFIPQAKVSAHFLASDVCVLPYRDGASYRRGTFMAALAHGCAIVTTECKPSPMRRYSVTSLPALRDGENVLLVPPADPPAIAEAVKRIAASPQLRATLQAGARATAQFFTWDKIADAHLELYQQVMVRR